ncbi:MAG: GNAT family N-acetyltransferase [Bacteroidota bacterium]
MDRKTKLYNSFSGMSPFEKRQLIDFICTYQEGAVRKNVAEALGYALKEKPSFGGFALSVVENETIVAAIIANNTGMKGYQASCLFLYVTVDRKKAKDELILKEMMRQALDLADGDVALRVEPKNPILSFFKKLGFTTSTLELRQQKTTAQSLFA